MTDRTSPVSETPDEMEERVARALQKAFPGREKSPVPYTPLMMLLARTAIEAMRGLAQSPPRQPTEAMLNAARDWSYKKYGKPIGNDAAIGCWQAMLAAVSDTSTNRPGLDELLHGMTDENRHEEVPVTSPVRK